MKWKKPKLENMSDRCFAGCADGSGAGGQPVQLTGGGAICQHGNGGQKDGEGCVGGQGNMNDVYSIYCYPGYGDDNCVTGTWDNSPQRCLNGSGVLPG